MRAGKLPRRSNSIASVARVPALPFGHVHDSRRVTTKAAPRTRPAPGGFESSRTGARTISYTGSAVVFLPHHVRLRLKIIRDASIESVGKSESCMVDQLRIIFKRTRCRLATG